MKRILLLVAFLSMSLIYSQTSSIYEKPPIFSECESESIENLKSCFNYELNAFVYENFKMPQFVLDDDYNGTIEVLFEVDNDGVFKVIYVDAINSELNTETKRVFNLLPKINPAMYNGKPTFVQYSISIAVPLQEPLKADLNITGNSEQNPPEGIDSLNATLSNEFDAVNDAISNYQGLEYSSELNVPFSHSFYARFDDEMNAIGTNSHTAAKPFVYSEVKKYYDIKAEKESLAQNVDSWFGRKLFNEHMVTVQGEDYWFTIDPIVDLQVGKDTEADFSSTWNNTRGIWIQAGLGKRLTLSTSIYESQGRFADYFNQYAEQLRANGSEAAIIPGRGLAKRFKTDAYDYPVAEAYLSYTPVDFLNIQFGHGKNFIGDGYRSLFQSDVASPYPFLKFNTNFWKIKYTSTWMWLRDIRPEVTVDGAFLPKYMANHYLSWNVSKRLNIGLFESVMWADTNGRGFDINYLNPIIFFRAIEFQTGQDAGNAILGLSAKYKWNNKVNLYGQFIVDEFSLSDVTGGDKSWKNKFGFQIGAKYYNAFKVDNLLLQAEYNQVRPYTYSHNSIILNYAHFNQPMAHLWGANFREMVLIGRYNYKRWFADAKFIIGQRGFDFNTPEDSFAYGGDIYTSENNRVGNTNIRIGQGNTTNSFMTEIQAGYLLNPETNLKLFTNMIYRDFNPEAITPTTMASNTLWFSIGLRTDLFNWYNDF